MNDDVAQRPYKRLSPLTPLVRSFILVVAAAGATWQDLLRGQIGPLGWALLVMLVVGAVFGTASWLRTKYWIENDELRVDTGVISRQSRRIRVDRLQGVDIVQPFVARLFGLAELKMDVAGGGRAEGSLAFLPLAEAQELREVLLARRDAVRAGGRPGDSPAVVPVAPRTQRLQERRIASLDLGMLLVAILLSGETIGVVVSGALFLGLFMVIGQLGGAASVLPIVGGFVLAQFRKLSAFYGFTLTESAAGLQVRRGLFERDAQTITLPRVQGLVVTEPLLWRRLGWARLDVSVAGAKSSDGDGKPSASTLMPVARRDQVQWLVSYLLAGSGAGADLQVDRIALTAPPARARWIAPVRRRYLAVGLGEVVVSRSGLVTRHTHVVPHARVQSLRIRQGPWQRMLGLADLHVDSPPGPVHAHARHRDTVEARALLEEETSLARAARHR